jgi:hypothetical protein
MGQFLDYRPGPGDGNEWSYPGDGGGVSNTANFTVSAALPTSLALSELTGAAGDTVTITGSGFGSGGTVPLTGFQLPLVPGVTQWLLLKSQPTPREAPFYNAVASCDIGFARHKFSAYPANPT